MKIFIGGYYTFLGLIFISSTCLNDCNGKKKIYLKNKDKKKYKNAKNAKNKTRKFRYYKDQLSVQKSNIKKIDSELLI